MYGTESHMNKRKWTVVVPEAGEASKKRKKKPETTDKLDNLTKNLDELKSIYKTRRELEDPLRKVHASNFDRSCCSSAKKGRAFGDSSTMASTKGGTIDNMVKNRTNIDLKKQGSETFLKSDLDVPSSGYLHTDSS